MLKTVRVRFAKIEQDLGHAYFCSLFCWIRSAFDIIFKRLAFESRTSIDFKLLLYLATKPGC